MSQAPPPVPDVVPAAADGALLDQLVEQLDVATATPGPGFLSYLRDLVVRVFQELADWIDSMLQRWGGAANLAAETLTWIVLSVAAVVLVVVALRWLRRRAPRDEVRAAVETLPGPSEHLLRDAEAWDAELARRLASGEIAAALESLWQWLATRLMGGEVDPSWTSRELAGRAARPDLLPIIGRLDRFLYGASPPSTGEIRDLRGRLGEAVRRESRQELAAATGESAP